jgi:outer membrane protein assembly factor BamD
MNDLISLSSSSPSSPFSCRAARCLLRVLAAVVLMGPLMACSTLDSLNIFGSEKYETKLLPDIPAEDIYDQGLARMRNGDHPGAAKKFAELDKQYPFSQWARKGLLMSTYAHYEGGEYDDAIADGTRYVGLYPSSDDAAYALYLVAMSQYNTVPDITRDQDSAEKALATFSSLVERYPKSEYVEDSKFKIQVVRDQLAGKEMSIGRYYLRKKNYTAAVNRFREVLSKYQTTRHTEEALYRLTEAYLGLGIASEAQTAAAVLGHNFPDGQWYQDAYKLLKSGHLEPNEDKGSWMSKLFRRVGLG